MRRTSILKLMTLLMTLALGAWICYSTPFTQAGQAARGPSSWLLLTGATIGMMLSRLRITRKKKKS
jgi:hypothetical protein